MTESVTATAYPTAAQYKRWKATAKQAGMSVSQFIASMTEAGMKNFTVDVEPDESNRELRESRDYYRREYKREHRKNEKLESQLHGGEPTVIESFVQSNPGATYDDILNHVVQTASQRVSSHLDTMSGTDLWKSGNEYYPLNNGEDGE